MCRFVKDLKLQVKHNAVVPVELEDILCVCVACVWLVNMFMILTFSLYITLCFARISGNSITVYEINEMQGIHGLLFAQHAIFN